MTTEIKQHTRRAPQPPIDAKLVEPKARFQKNRAENQGKPPIIVEVDDVVVIAGQMIVHYHYPENGKRRTMPLVDFCRGSEHKTPDPEPETEPTTMEPVAAPEATAEAAIGPVTADATPEEPSPASGVATRDTWRASAELDAVPLGSAEEERLRARGWMDIAAQHCRNEEYWRERARAAETAPAAAVVRMSSALDAKLDEILAILRRSAKVDAPAQLSLLGGAP